MDQEYDVKIGVLELLIRILKEHEERLDAIVSRLEATELNQKIKRSFGG